MPPADLGDYDLHPLAAQPTHVLLLVRAALEKSAITIADAAELLGTSIEEIRQLLSTPSPSAGFNVFGLKRRSGARQHG